MTVSTDTWYSGYHPYTLQPEFSAHTPDEKLRQRMFFFWYKPEERPRIIRELKRMGRPDLINRLYPQGQQFMPFTPEPTRGNKTAKTKPSAQRTDKPHRAEKPYRTDNVHRAEKPKQRKSYNPNFNPAPQTRKGKRR